MGAITPNFPCRFNEIILMYRMTWLDSTGHHQLIKKEESERQVGIRGMLLLLQNQSMNHSYLNINLFIKCHWCTIHRNWILDKRLGKECLGPVNPMRHSVPRALRNCIGKQKAKCRLNNLYKKAVRRKSWHKVYVQYFGKLWNLYEIKKKMSERMLHILCSFPGIHLALPPII